MNELLLQTIIEKLEAIELLLRAETADKTDMILQKHITEQFYQLHKEIKLLPAQLSLNKEQMNELLRSINNCTLQLKQPVQNSVEHKHHLHKGIWIAVCLFVICFLLSWGWLNTYQSVEQSEANDIKYRYLKITGNEWLLKLCNQTDSMFQKDEENFKIEVQRKEQYLLQQGELIHSAGERKKKQKK